MTDGAHTPNHHPHGSIGEEAVKLAEAVQDWLGERTHRGASDAWAAATAPDAFEADGRAHTASGTTYDPAPEPSGEE